MPDERPVGEQLGLPDYQYFILCVACQERLEGDHHYMLALFGPQGMTDETAILVCVPWPERASSFLFRSEPAHCDGCGAMVAVAPSSAWFVREYVKERT